MKYIIFHDNCLDGFMAALVMHTALSTDAFKQDDIRLVPAQYGEDPVKVDQGDSLYLVDFSYPISVLDEYRDNGCMVYTFDHHKSAILDMCKAGAIVKDELLSYTSDTDRRYKDYMLNYFVSYNEAPNKENKHKLSGASLVKEVYFCNEDRQKLLCDSLGKDILDTLELARQHDLWLHDGNPDSDGMHLSYWFKEFTKTHKEKFKTLKGNLSTSLDTFNELKDHFTSTSLKEKLHIGQCMLDDIVSKLDVIVSKAKDTKLAIPGYEGYKIGTVIDEDVAKYGISLAGSIMVNTYGWDVAIISKGIKDGDTEMVLSLRSNQNGTSVDVSEIAKEYVRLGIASSGGGHKNAAGMAIPIQNLQRAISDIKEND